MTGGRGSRTVVSGDELHRHLNGKNGNRDQEPVTIQRRAGPRNIGSFMCSSPPSFKGTRVVPFGPEMVASVGAVKLAQSLPLL